jgi:hypothetical protein
MIQRTSHSYPQSIDRHAQRCKRRWSALVLEMKEPRCVEFISMQPNALKVYLGTTYYLATYNSSSTLALYNATETLQASLYRETRCQENDRLDKATGHIHLIMIGA